MHEAMFCEKLGNNRVRCALCRHRCSIGEGKTGICHVRQNKDGVLYSLVYDRVIAQHIDPIEKKPLFHFFPGSHSFSIATPGCNFKCLHCQNADISQMPVNSGHISGDALPPSSLVETAVKNNCTSISYTYTEPTIFFELAYDAAKLASERGLKNVFVTNGYITAEALKQISPFLDAANIDLKSFNKEFYRKICGADLDQVLDSIKTYHALGIWIEATTLIIPKLNDSVEELRQIAAFLAALNPDIPWHVSGFYPTYKLLDHPPTPIETLLAAREIGIQEGLKYVYTGNAPGKGGESTHCPDCGKIVVKRRGYSILENRAKGGTCEYCGAAIAGVGM